MDTPHNTSEFSRRLHGLVTSGEQFPLQDEWQEPLGEGLSYINNRGDPTAATIDMHTSRSVSSFYPTDSGLRSALAARSLTTRSPHELAAVIENAFDARRLIVGFSGYASGGPRYHYREEAEGIVATLDILGEANHTPCLVVDGGTSLGVPGLSGLLAQERGIATLGCLPLEGLKSLAPCDHIAVIGERYQDETALIGAVPDILLFFGGGPNAVREYRAALGLGSRAVAVILKDYPEKSLARTHEQIAATHRAKRLGKMAVCRSLTSLREHLTRYAAQDLTDNRPQRLEAIRALLASRPC